MRALFIVATDGTTEELIEGTMQHAGYELGVAWHALVVEIRAAFLGT